MKSIWLLYSVILIAGIEILGWTANDIVLNEIHYNPDGTGRAEFIELANPTGRVLDIGGYAFTDGIYFSFPSGTMVIPGEYVVVVRDPNDPRWRNRIYPIFGPYVGKLSNSGELIRLRSKNGAVVDEIEYSDQPPWPLAPDGYNASLEKVSPTAPSDDFHSWRASFSRNGTPNQQNSVYGTPAYPMLLDWELDPPSPAPTEEVEVTIQLDALDTLESVVLLVETYVNGVSDSVDSYEMVRLGQADATIWYRAVLPPQPSETLVRMVAEARFTNAESLRLPHPADPRPFESYFVYDFSIPSVLPVMWKFTRLPSQLIPLTRYYSAVAIQSSGSATVDLYDGVIIQSSRNGEKIRFLKGREFEGNRTLNLIPEAPTGNTTSGTQAPFVEHLSHEIFRDFGVMAPYVYWFRVIGNGVHRQQIAIQQPNEAFLAMNGRDPNSNIYKIAYNEPGGYSKKTNLDEGDDDFRALMSAINVSNQDQRALALRMYLDIEKVMAYEVASVAMSNWDGFHNNLFLYHDLPSGKWECIPWDLDKTFGYTDSNPMFVEMPLTYPYDGRAAAASREPGRVSRPFHSDPELNETYIYRLRDALSGLFSIERIEGKVDAWETLLIEDTDLIEQYTKTSKQIRRNQIRNSYDVIRAFMRLRHQYLQSVLPVSVENWPLY